MDITDQEEDGDDIICVCLRLLCINTLCVKDVSLSPPWCLCVFPRGRQPWYYGWGFNLPRGQALLDKWNQIPESTDILLTHCPPLGESLIKHTHTHTGTHFFTSFSREFVSTETHTLMYTHTFALRALADGVATAGC